MVEVMTAIPASHKDLLSTEIGTFATVGPDGRPQLSVVWFLADGDDVTLSLSTRRQKVKNLIARPACSLCIVDPAVPQRYLELRGDAEIVPDDDYAFASRVGEKYGVDLRTFDEPGDRRLAVRIVPSRVHAFDLRG